MTRQIEQIAPKLTMLYTTNCLLHSSKKFERSLNRTLTCLLSWRFFINLKGISIEHQVAEFIKNLAGRSELRNYAAANRSNGLTTSTHVSKCV